MTNAEIIQKALEQQGLKSEYAVAKRLAVTPATVYAWRDGRAQPNRAHLMALLEMAGLLGKLSAGAAITIAALLAVTTGDASAATGSVRGALNTSIHYAKLLCLHPALRQVVPDTPPQQSNMTTALSMSSYVFIHAQRHDISNDLTL